MINIAENTVPMYVYVPLHRDSTKHHPIPRLVTDIERGFFRVEIPLPSDSTKRITNWFKIEDCKGV